MYESSSFQIFASCLEASLSRFGFVFFLLCIVNFRMYSHLSGIYLPLMNLLRYHKSQCGFIKKRLLPKVFLYKVQKLLENISPFLFDCIGSFHALVVFVTSSTMIFSAFAFDVCFYLFPFCSI